MSPRFCWNIAHISTPLATTNFWPHFQMQYISLLRKCRMSTRLRQARQSMHSRFPLTPELWLEWLEDELSGKTDSKFMEHLFQLAVDDYLSVKLWEKYLRWVKHSSSGLMLRHFLTASASWHKHIKSQYPKAKTDLCAWASNRHRAWIQFSGIDFFIHCGM